MEFAIKSATQGSLKPVIKQRQLFLPAETHKKFVQTNQVSDNIKSTKPSPHFGLGDGLTSESLTTQPKLTQSTEPFAVIRETTRQEAKRSLHKAGANRTDRKNKQQARREGKTCLPTPDGARNTAVKSNEKVRQTPKGREREIEGPPSANHSPELTQTPQEQSQGVTTPRNGVWENRREPPLKKLTQSYPPSTSKTMEERARRINREDSRRANAIGAGEEIFR
ncbi:unnamed protein product [Arabidopsis thaliana]|uniref:Uncharacterized protein n=1 Tax=Arabidopsis thaliana TaxID=3702 RepID=A0A654FA05_ARATH|nr:unnamed protein product [Arabidopsis thaliana]